MAYLDGGRTLTLSMPFAGNLQFHHSIPPVTTRPTAILTIASGGGLNGSTWQITTTEHKGSGASYRLEATIQVQNHGVAATATFDIINGALTPPGAYNATMTYTGSFTVTEEVDRLWDVVETAYVNGSIPDAPAYTTLNQYEISKVGTTSVATLTFMGHTVTASAVITSSNRTTMDYRATLNVDYFAHDTGSGAFSAVPTINGSPLHSGYSHSYSGGAATDWGVSATAPTRAIGPDGVRVQLTATAKPDRQVTSRGTLRTWGGTLPSAVSVRIYGFDVDTLGYRDVSTASTWDASYTQSDYTFGSVITITGSSDSDSLSLHTYASVRAAILASSLTALGDDANATRVLQRGWRFSGASLAHAASLSVAGSGNSRAYSPHQGMSGYRYLDVEVTSTTGFDETRTLRITDAWGLVKEWQVMAPASGAPTTRRIDLRAPTNLSTVTDAWDNPYPRRNTADATYASDEGQDGPMTGVTKAASLEMVGAAGVTLGATTLVRASTATSTLVPSLGWFAERKTRAQVATDTTTTYYGRRFWQGEVDVRREEETDVEWQVTLGPTGIPAWLYSNLTILGLCNAIGVSDAGVVRHPGWSATNQVALPGGCSVSQPALRDCYLNGETGYAVWLHGGGILAYPESVGNVGTRYEYGIDLDHSSAATVDAQTLFDEVLGWIPDIPDPLDLNRPAAGPPEVGLFLAGGAILRAQAVGIVLDSAGLPSVGATVQVDDAGATPTNRGTGVTGSDGGYKTGTPFALAIRSVSIHPTSVGAPSIAATAYTRKRIDAAFRAAAAGRVLSADIGPTLRAVRAVEVGGYLALEWADLPDGSAWSRRMTSLAIGGEACVRMDRVLSQGRAVVALHTAGGAIERRHTEDEGGTWSVATTISASGKHPAVALGDTGVEAHFWWETGGIIKTKVLDSQQQTMIVATTVVASGAADDGIAAYVRQERIFLLYRDTSGNLLTVSSVNGTVYA